MSARNDRRVDWLFEQGQGSLGGFWAAAETWPRFWLDAERKVISPDAGCRKSARAGWVSGPSDPPSRPPPNAADPVLARAQITSTELRKAPHQPRPTADCPGNHPTDPDTAEWGQPSECWRKGRRPLLGRGPSPGSGIRTLVRRESVRGRRQLRDENAHSMNAFVRLIDFDGDS